MKLKITQTKSTIACLKDQIATIKALGLHKIGHTVVKADNPATRGMIDANAIARMKDGALLINLARGPVVDTAALAAALESGKLGGAGIDVFETEPPLPKEHPLLHTPNTLVTPHVAFASEESMALRAQIVFENLDAFLRGEPQNLVEL